MSRTQKQFRSVFNTCESIFLRKHEDYGSNWRIFRPASLTDQMYIKAMRIRTIEEKGVNKVKEPIDGEYMALVNYGILALIQLELTDEEALELPLKRVTKLYNHYKEEAEDLMMKKNHDYGEAWRTMRISSITDLILAKILRIKQIEDNRGVVSASEGVEGNYFDIIIYAVFCLIRLEEAHDATGELN